MDLDWIRRGLERPGKSQLGLAEALGIHPSGVSRLLDGKRHLKANEIAQVKNYLGGDEQPEALPPSDADIARIRAGEDLVGGRDLPVFASAEGGPSGLIVSSEPIDYVKRPEPLLHASKGFGVYVIGDSMVPAYVQGDLLLVHPSLPPKRGDDVLLTRQSVDGERAALIKHLVSWTADHWKVKQWNPAREFQLKRTDWQQAHVIVGKYGRR